MLPDREHWLSQSTCDAEGNICVLPDGSTGFDRRLTNEEQLRGKNPDEAGTG